MKWNRVSISAVIFLSALVLFVPFLGLSHLFDWDEVNFAEAAREMLVSGEFSYVQINFKPFWEKPPLFIWLQALSMSIFGINEFAARFPNAICGAVTLTLLYNIGETARSRKFGLLWVLVYAGSILPQFYFRSGIIDPWFNLFIFLGIYQLIEATSHSRLNRKNLTFSAILIGLAVLTKGPTAFGLVGISFAVYFALNFRKHNWLFLDAILYAGIVLLVGFSWFLFEVLRGRGYVIQEFIDYHIRLLSQSEAGHGQPFYYHAIVLLLGCFPMVLFFIFGWFKKTPEDEKTEHFAQWMSILFWVVFIVFSIVKTKIVHYSSLTYFPMSFLATVSIYNLMQSRWKFSTVHQILLLLFIVILGSVFVLIGMFNSIKEPLLELLKNDPLTFGNFSQNIPDKTLDPWIGVFFMIMSMASVVLLLMGKTTKGIIGLYGTTMITVMLLTIFIAPKIDRYIQKPLFDFYQEHEKEAYLQPLAFHSYAHLFYGKRPPITERPEDELKWLLFDEIDRPVYFISRPQDLNTNLKYFPHLKETSKKGGYVILERTDENYPF